MPGFKSQTMARFLILLILLFSSNPALAARDRVFSVEVDNDVLTPTDQYFTNGVRVGVAFGEAAQKPWMDKLADKIPFLSKSYNERIISFALGGKQPFATICADIDK